MIYILIFYILYFTLWGLLRVMPFGWGRAGFRVDGIVAWYDLWVGVYIEQANHIWLVVYIFAIPMVGFKLRIPKR